MSSVAVGRLRGREVIVSGSDDGTVRVWDEAGRPFWKAIDFLDPVRALTLRPGRLLVAAGVALICLVSDEGHGPSD